MISFIHKKLEKKKWDVTIIKVTEEEITLLGIVKIKRKKKFEKNLDKHSGI